jgi:aconitate hydratase 2/2-methylisocitrate dehydratase
MNKKYREHVAERAKLGIPPLPLSSEQVEELVRMVKEPPQNAGEELLDMLTNRVPPGVNPAAGVKADFLASVAEAKAASPLISPTRAVELLGTMLGGYNVPHLVRFLDSNELAGAAAEALKVTLSVLGDFASVKDRMNRGNAFARDVMKSWAEAEWFTSMPTLPQKMKLKVYRVDGEVNTDDLSPAGHASTRSDIPLHALSMGQERFPDGTEVIAEFRSEGYDVAFVSDVLGTGSSRKSATNSMIWHIGQDIPHVPNKRRGGVVIAAQIAPIYFSTFEDSGGLPIQADPSRLTMGQVIIVEPHAGRITDENGKQLATFKLSPVTLPDEFRAGGRLWLIIGRRRAEAAREALSLPATSVFMAAPKVEKKSAGFTLAQKLVGRACGKDGVMPGEKCEPGISTVGSQDTTGSMTADELMELGCLRFQADLVMQSFCHTAAYPTDKDKRMHSRLTEFFADREGVVLRPGDGIIHSWINRLLVPDQVGTGGDSHTRFPMGISFPAGSGLVAFAGAMGFMPLEMPESVLVRFSGEFRGGITLRDLVNTIPLAAMREGLLSRYGEGTENVFNGRILEMEGLPRLAAEQAFELTCASAERSAAAATIELDIEQVVKYLESNIALMRFLIDQEYEYAETLRRRIRTVETWLANPSLLKRDDRADFAAEIHVDLNAITEPVVACPNHPDNVRTLSDAAGAKVDEVFIGSCMTNIGLFRAAAKILSAADSPLGVKRLWITPPTRMDLKQLEREGLIEEFRNLGARVEIPGCSLCMGNQARVEDDAVVFSTSTRNFDNRVGSGAQVYLGSAELGALVARLGRLPKPGEYFSEYERCIAPSREEVYRVLDFSKMVLKELLL